jgi:hypothetical protein
LYNFPTNIKKFATRVGRLARFERVLNEPRGHAQPPWCNFAIDIKKLLYRGTVDALKSALGDDADRLLPICHV